jgi:o-succinylbenzoate synthase
MKIAAARFSAFTLPMRRALSAPNGKLTERAGFILTLVSDGGLTGRGEASAAYWLGAERLDAVRTGLEWIVKCAVDQPDADDLRRFIFGQKADCTHPLSPAAACALDGALLDLAAKTLGVAAASILGAGSLEPMAVSALLIGTAPDDLAEEAESAVAAGHRTLKVKVGTGSVDEDLRRLRAVHAAVKGGQVALRIDANRAWSGEDATRALRALAPLGIDFVEEPLASPTPASMAALRKAAAGVALALDESVSCAAELERYVKKEAADIVVLKAARLGGPTRCLELASLASATGMRTVVTDSIETAIGMGVAVHLAAALPGPPEAIGLGGARLLVTPADPAGDFEVSPWVRPAGPGFRVEAAAQAG